jgi:cytochrome P450
MDSLHVNASGIADLPLSALDPAVPENFADDSVYPIFARLRAEAPVHYTTVGPDAPYWSVTRYADIMAVDTNHKVYSSDVVWGGVGLNDMPKDFVLPMFISADPPKHEAQRKVVAPILFAGHLAYLEGLIRERAGALLDAQPLGETFDWVDAVSVELTTQMLATLFDFPWEERRLLTRWSNVATSPPGKGVTSSEAEWQGELMGCLQYFMNLWNERQALPPAANLISMLAHGAATRDMPPMEFLGNIMLLIVGGNDTTRNSITGSVYALNKFPAEYEKLRQNHGLIPDLVAETVRWQTPLSYQRRTANQDTELAGQRIKAGEKVVMWYASGNRDEAVFERGNDFIIGRENARRHLGFGFGIHRCFGMRLAEMQLRIVWEEILKRWMRIEVMAEPARVSSNLIHGYTAMPVRVHA